MKTIITLAATAVLLTGFINASKSAEFTTQAETGNAVKMLTEGTGTLSSIRTASKNTSADISPMNLSAVKLTEAYATEKRVSTPVNIAVARLHDGSFLPLPYQEASAWQAINDTTLVNFAPLSASVHFDVLPSIPLGGIASDNRIDEIRMAAVDSDQDYVLIYAVNDGASRGRFGDRNLNATGLSYDISSNAVRNGDAKALLVEAYTGKVVGAVTTFAPDMGTLTKLVSEMTTKVLDV